MLTHDIISDSHPDIIRSSARAEVRVSQSRDIRIVAKRLWGCP